AELQSLARRDRALPPPPGALAAAVACADALGCSAWPLRAAALGRAEEIRSLEAALLQALGSDDESLLPPAVAKAEAAGLSAWPLLQAAQSFLAPSELEGSALPGSTKRWGHFSSFWASQRLLVESSTATSLSAEGTAISWHQTVAYVGIALDTACSDGQGLSSVLANGGLAEGVRKAVGGLQIEDFRLSAVGPDMLVAEFQLRSTRSSVGVSGTMLGISVEDALEHLRQSVGDTSESQKQRLNLGSEVSGVRLLYSTVSQQIDEQEQLQQLRKLRHVQKMQQLQDEDARQHEELLFQEQQLSLQQEKLQQQLELRERQLQQTQHALERQENLLMKSGQEHLQEIHNQEQVMLVEPCNSPDPGTSVAEDMLVELRISSDAGAPVVEVMLVEPRSSSDTGASVTEVMLGKLRSASDVGASVAEDLFSADRCHDLVQGIVQHALNTVSPSPSPSWFTAERPFSLTPTLGDPCVPLTSPGEESLSDSAYVEAFANKMAQMLITLQPSPSPMSLGSAGCAESPSPLPDPHVCLTSAGELTQQLLAELSAVRSLATSIREQGSSSDSVHIEVIAKNIAQMLRKPQPSPESLSSEFPSDSAQIEVLALNMAQMLSMLQPTPSPESLGSQGPSLDSAHIEVIANSMAQMLSTLKPSPSPVSQSVEVSSSASAQLAAIADEEVARLFTKGGALDLASVGSCTVLDEEISSLVPGGAASRDLSAKELAGGVIHEVLMDNLRLGTGDRDRDSSSDVFGPPAASNGSSVMDGSDAIFAKALAENVLSLAVIDADLDDSLTDNQSLNGGLIWSQPSQHVASLHPE
ncbi:unnamed protein product, partial [Polarella glacialis]